MARQEVDIGVEGNDGTGDSIRESFKKVNENFTELYAVFGLGGTIGFTRLDDVPDTYLGNETSVPLVRSDATGISFYELVSDSNENNNNTSNPSSTTNSVFFEFDDPDPATPNESGKLKVIINDPHIDRDPDPNVKNPLNAEAAFAYSNSIDNVLRNTSSGPDIDTLVSDWNTTHSNASPITSDNIIINKGFADDNYVNESGDSMSGFLEYDSSVGLATGNQLPRVNEVITRGGAKDNRTMLDDLFLADHPEPLQGAGTPNGEDDLLAVSKLYVDTQGYSSTTNLYVSTSGDDDQTFTPAGKEGRSESYAYRTISAAMRQAERIIESTPFEPGPYVQTVTFGRGRSNSEIDSVAGVVSPVATSEAASQLIIDNSSTIQTIVTDYINSEYPDFVYDSAICQRDIGLILDSIRLDVQSGLTANYLTRWAGLRYNSNPSAIKAKTTQYTQTRDGILRAKTEVNDILTNDGTISASVIDAYDNRFDELLRYIDSDLDNDDPLVTGNNYIFELTNGGFDSVDQGAESNPDLIPGKIIVGRTTGAKGEIINYERSFTGTTDRITVQLLEPIEFSTNEELEFGNITKSNQITVRVESGIYDEHFPIKLPENVSIKGDEFRRVVVRPKAGVSESPWAKTYFYRDTVIDGLVAAQSNITAIYNFQNTASDPNRVDGVYSVNQFVTNGIGSGAEFQVTVSGGEVTSITVENGGDGFLLDEIITIDDSQLGDGGAADIDFQVQTTGGGFDFIHPVNGKQGKYGYHYLTDPLDSESTPLENKEMDVFLCNDGVIVRNITVQRHGGFMMTLDPEGQILTRSPYCQTGSSFSQSKGTRRNFAGGLFIDGYAGNMPATIDNVVNGFTLEVSSPAGQGLFVRRPPTPFPFFINGARYQVNAVTDYDQDNGTATLILDESSNPDSVISRNIVNITKNNPAVVTTSDDHGFNSGTLITINSVNGMVELNGNNYYINVIDSTSFELYIDDALTVGVDSTTFNNYIDGGIVSAGGSGLGYQGGSGQDIFIQSGGNRSMLANDFTQINDLGFGCLAINNALSELVSMFTYYCHTGYIAADGSQIRSISGNNSYGVYGLVAEGSDPDEVATDVSLNSNMVFPGKTFNASTKITFSSSVPGSVDINETISQEVSGAEAKIAFFLNNRTEAFVYDVTGNFNTSDQVFGDDSTTLIGVPSEVELIDASASENSLFMYAYDLTELPHNVSEVEILHDSGLYQPYEITNASLTGLTLNSYNINSSIYTYNGNIGTGASFIIAKNRTDGYKIISFDSGSDYVIGESFTVSGTQLGGATPANDATVTVDNVDDNGAILELSVTGTILEEATTPVVDGTVWRFNFGTGLEGTAENGLQEPTLHNTRLVIRHKQNFVFDGVNELPTRPSTAIEFTDDTDAFTYRSIAFTQQITDGFIVGNNQSVITFDENFRYLDLTTEQTAIELAENDANITVQAGFTDIIANSTPDPTKTLGSTIGDRFIAINTLGDINQDRIADGELIVSWGGKTHTIDAYSEYIFDDGINPSIQFAVIGITDISGTDINVPTTASGLANSLSNERGITLKGGLAAGEEASITINISTCRATGHDMLDIGVGGFNQANYPDRIYGQPVTEPVSTNDAIDSTGNRSRAQIQERNKGRVFAVTTDQDGFFRVGRFFTVDQGTGSVTFNAALVLTNIDGIGFKRGVRVNEFSNDDTFTDAKGDAVPTQTATQGYIDARLGFNRDGITAGVVPIGPGVMSLGGPGFDQTPMQDDMNLGGFQINNLALPTTADDAATKGYVDSKTDNLNDIGDVTITGSGSALSANLLSFTGTAQDSENSNVIGDVLFFRTAANELTTAINTGVIVNDDINSSAGILQSKLTLNAASTRASATGITQADLGVASFNSANFTATDGLISIATGGISNTELANSTITIGSTNISLGSSSTSLSGLSGLAFSSGNISGTVSWTASGSISNVSTINHTGNITGPANSGSNNGVSIGSSSNRYNTVWASVFNGTATEALYADLAENYLGDADYEPGTVLVFGGDEEVTACSVKGDTRVAGVVTTNPAHLMNSALQGNYVTGIALQGRVPCKVIGKVAKGDMLVTSAVPGYAIVNNNPGVGQVVGKAVGTKDDTGKGTVETVVGRV